MSTKEATRYAVIQKVLDKEISQRIAGQQLGLSTRQIKRLSVLVRAQGAAGLISKRRGLPSNRTIPASHKTAIMSAVRERYYDFGPQLASEYLAEQDALPIGTETLRSWMIADGLWKPKIRRKKRQHPPRPRRSHRGELVQIDGSPHDWFEGRSPVCCLIAFIDDATGQILAARFSPSETTQAYFAVMQTHIKQHGIPLAYYSDRHAIFTKHDTEDPNPTQFERALLQLGIEGICAHSPQAKGRVERLFQTLQDRLCKAMRLANISGIEQGNTWLQAYIQVHNKRFAIVPQETQDAHRSLAHTHEQLARICALHHQRQLSPALSCQFEGAQIWIEPNQVHAPAQRARVDIAQYADGHIELLYRGHVLKHRCYEVHEHLKKQRVCDDKTINQRVDALAQHRRKIAAIAAQIKLQDDLRAMGITQPDTHPSPLPRDSSRYGLRPTQLESRI